MTEQQYNIIKRYKPLWESFKSNSTMILSYDIKQEMEKVYKEITGVPKVCLHCSGAVKEMAISLFSLMEDYESRLKVKQKRKRIKE